MVLVVYFFIFFLVHAHKKFLKMFQNDDNILPYNIITFLRFELKLLVKILNNLVISIICLIVFFLFFSLIVLLLAI